MRYCWSKTVEQLLFYYNLYTTIAFIHILNYILFFYIFSVHFNCSLKCIYIYIALYLAKLLVYYFSFSNFSTHDFNLFQLVAKASLFWDFQLLLIFH